MNDDGLEFDKINRLTGVLSCIFFEEFMTASVSVLSSTSQFLIGLLLLAIDTVLFTELLHLVFVSGSRDSEGGLANNTASLGKCSSRHKSIDLP